MKKILADFLGLSEIESYSFKSEHSLAIETERDYGNSYSIIAGEIYQPQYEVVDLDKKSHWVSLEDLLIFIYNKK